MVMRRGGDVLSGAPSVARALDEARAQIVRAWDRGERPSYLLCSPALYALVADSKKPEIDAGRPLRLLGLLLVSSATMSDGEVAVH